MSDIQGAHSAESTRVGRWLGLWTVERWNQRTKVWDVIFTFPTEEEATAYLQQSDGRDDA